MLLPCLIVGQHSDIGRTREENQDASGSFTNSKGRLFTVADGMGGLAGGKIASELAVRVVGEVFERDADPLPQVLKKSLLEANARIFEQSQTGNPLYRGMGTTGVVLVFSEDKAFVAHVGDSRIYLIRNSEIQRLTKDHSEVQYLLDKGALTADEAANYPNRNVLLRALGTHPAVEVDLPPEPIKLQIGDQFLLCTDGLSGCVTDSEIPSDSAER